MPYPRPSFAMECGAGRSFARASYAPGSRILCSLGPCQTLGPHLAAQLRMLGGLSPGPAARAIRYTYYYTTFTKLPLAFWLGLVKGVVSVALSASLRFCSHSPKWTRYTTSIRGTAQLTPFVKFSIQTRMPACPKGKAGTRAVVKEEEKRIDLCRNLRLCRKIAGCRRAAMQSNITGGPACFVPLCSGLLPAHILWVSPIAHLAAEFRTPRARTKCTWRLARGACALRFPM